MSQKIHQYHKLEYERYNLLKSISKDDIKAYITGLFEKYPELGGICWTGYTNVYNDGDPTSFGMGDVWMAHEVSPEEWATVNGDEHCEDVYSFIDSLDMRCNEYNLVRHYKEIYGNISDAYRNRLLETGSAISGQINSLETLWQYVLGDPHRLTAVRFKDNIHIIIEDDIDIY